jgi:hypothetical protein
LSTYAHSKTEKTSEQCQWFLVAEKGTSLFSNFFWKNQNTSSSRNSSLFPPTQNKSKYKHTQNRKPQTEIKQKTENELKPLSPEIDEDHLIPYELKKTIINKTICNQKSQRRRGGKDEANGVGTEIQRRKQKQRRRRYEEDESRTDEERPIRNISGQFLFSSDLIRLDSFSHV